MYLNVEWIGDEEDGDEEDEEDEEDELELALSPHIPGNVMHVSLVPPMEELLAEQVDAAQMTKDAISWVLGLNVRVAAMS